MMRWPVTSGPRPPNWPDVAGRDRPFLVCLGAQHAQCFIVRVIAGANDRHHFAESIRWAQDFLGEVRHCSVADYLPRVHPVAGTNGRLEGEAVVHVRFHAGLDRVARHVGERPQQTVEDPSRQTRPQPYRQGLPDPGDPVPRPETRRVLVNLCDDLFVADADYLAEEIAIADEDRVTQPEAARATGAKHRATDPRDGCVRHARSRPAAPTPQAAMPRRPRARRVIRSLCRRGRRCPP